MLFVCQFPSMSVFWELVRVKSKSWKPDHSIHSGNHLPQSRTVSGDPAPLHDPCARALSRVRWELRSHSTDCSEACLPATIALTSWLVFSSVSRCFLLLTEGKHFPAPPLCSTMNFTYCLWIILGVKFPLFGQYFFILYFLYLKKSLSQHCSVLLSFLFF